MVHSGRRGLVGLAVGLGTGIVAAVLLAPRRRSGPGRSRAALAADSVLDLARGLLDCAQAIWRNVSASESASGLLPDERVTLRVQEELENRGLWGRSTNVTTIDGAVYVRGRELDALRAETVLRAVREVPGVVEVVDELKRE